MIRSVKYCYQNDLIASFYCNDGKIQQRLVGRVERFNDSEILIAHISSHGYYDGFILKHIEDVCRIEYGGAYEKRIERLYKLKKQSHKSIETFNANEDEILFSFLDFAKANDYIICLEFVDNSVSGLLNGYSDDVVYLEVINDYGNCDGILIANIDEIFGVAVDTDDEQDLRLMYFSKEE